MKIFISYATQDLRSFRISEMVHFLEAQEDIEKVWYWDRDSKDFSSIIAYMEFGITNCDVFLAISTIASYNSAPVNQEIDLAIYSNKKMIPVFEKIKDVRPLLRPKTGIKFLSSNFQKFLSNLLFILINKRKLVPIETQNQKQKVPIKEKIQLKKKEYKIKEISAFIGKNRRRIDQLEKRIDTEDLTLEDENKIMQEIDELERKLQGLLKINKNHRRINQLEKKIETEDLSVEEHNKIVDEIDKLERKV